MKTLIFDSLFCQQQQQKEQISQTSCKNSILLGQCSFNQMKQYLAWQVLLQPDKILSKHPYIIYRYNHILIYSYTHLPIILYTHTIYIPFFIHPLPIHIYPSIRNQAPIFSIISSIYSTDLDYHCYFKVFLLPFLLVSNYFCDLFCDLHIFQFCIYIFG